MLSAGGAGTTKSTKMCGAVSDQFAVAGPRARLGPTAREPLLGADRGEEMLAGIGSPALPKYTVEFGGSPKSAVCLGSSEFGEFP